MRSLLHIPLTMLARMAVRSTIVDSTDELAYHEPSHLQRNPPTARPACNERNPATMRLPLAFALLVGLVAPIRSAEPVPPKVSIDPLDCRWTFGNHEPISMYRRSGGYTTGGIEGGALWLRQWHHWFDSEACPQLMQDLGLNFVHSRFYKGMGWQYESRDFPNVKQFVTNCHKHGVRALAYIQFSTLYYETMLSEIPDLADWVALDEHGEKRTWHGQYFRWVPCHNNPDFEAYLKKMIRIAVVDGGFDGVMFDNCDMPPCYCPRCIKLFREYLAHEPNPEDRFGLPTVVNVQPPILQSSKFGETQDPIHQEWVRFRSKRQSDLFHRLYEHTKRCKPSAIFSGNVTNIRRVNMAGRDALSMHDLGDCFDIFVSQSDNAPGLQGTYIVNRVRELKLAEALHTPILALADSDIGAGAPTAQAKGNTLMLIEDAVFGGIPTDRRVLKADPQMVSPERVAVHRELLRRFDQTVRTHRTALAAPSYEPVKVLYSREAIMLSQASYEAVLSTEEILLRHHIPYGLLLTAADVPLVIPDDCEVLLVPDVRCLADAQIDALVSFARKGGRMIASGQSGRYNADYRQRPDNPLAKTVAGLDNVVRRDGIDTAPVKSSWWRMQVGAPVDGGKRLLADLGKLWSPPVRIKAPESVFVEVTRDQNALYIHLLNYNLKVPASNVRVEFATDKVTLGECTVAVPMEKRSAAPVLTSVSEPGWRVIQVPTFAEYAVVSAEIAAVPELYRYTHRGNSITVPCPFVISSLANQGRIRVAVRGLRPRRVTIYH